QPIQDKGSIPSCQSLVEIRECSAEGVVDLCTVEIAKRVAWEVAKAGGPVDILQHSFGIRRRLNAQVLLILSVPKARQRLNCNLTIDQRLLQLEAYNDMQVVCHFVSLDPNQAWLHFIKSTSEGGNIHMGKLFRKRLAHDCKLTLPVRFGAPDRIFP